MTQASFEIVWVILASPAHRAFYIFAVIHKIPSERNLFRVNSNIIEESIQGSGICCDVPLHILRLSLKCRPLLLAQIFILELQFQRRALPLNNKVKLYCKFRNAGTHYLINRYKALIVSCNDNTRYARSRNDLFAS